VNKELHRIPLPNTPKRLQSRRVLKRKVTRVRHHPPPPRSSPPPAGSRVRSLVAICALSTVIFALQAADFPICAKSSFAPRRRRGAHAAPHVDRARCATRTAPDMAWRRTRSRRLPQRPHQIGRPPTTPSSSSCPRQSKHVFRDSARGAPQSGDGQPTVRAARAGGRPPPLTFHGLRHTFATLALRAGVPSKVVAEVLGYASAHH
jgi:Phage integrase family